MNINIDIFKIINKLKFKKINRIYYFILMVGGVIGIKLFFLWYVIDFCLMISVLLNGLGIEIKIFFFKFIVLKIRYNFKIFYFDFLLVISM